MAEFNFTDLGSPQTALSTGLNSLANGSGALASAVDNADGDFWAAWELNLGSIDLSAQNNPYISVYFIQSIDDGSTYADGSSGAEPTGRPDVIFALREVNGAQIPPIQVAHCPQNFKPLLFNHAGVALAATSNTLRYAEFSSESN